MASGVNVSVSACVSLHVGPVIRVTPPLAVDPGSGLDLWPSTGSWVHELGRRKASAREKPGVVPSTWQRRGCWGRSVALILFQQLFQQQTIENLQKHSRVMIFMFFSMVLNEIYKCRGSTQCSQGNTSPLNSFFIRSELGALWFSLGHPQKHPAARFHGPNGPRHPSAG